MNDLRDAHAVDRREATRYDLPAAQRLDPADLRTVPMPDLRTAEARELDAEARDLRTGPEREHDDVAALRGDIAELKEENDWARFELSVLREAIERHADALTMLMLERDLRREQQPDAMDAHQRRMYAAATVALAATLALGVLMWWLQGGVG